MSLSFYSQWFGLDGQAAVVLGGSGCLGGAVAEGLARAGATIVVAGRSEARGHACVERIRSCGGNAGFRAVDLEQPGAPQQLLDFAVGEHGEVDMLVNAATPRWQPVWIEQVSEVFSAAMARQAAGGAVLNLAPPDLPGAAEATSRLAREHAGRVRLNVILTGPKAGEPLTAAALLLLSRRAGAPFNGCQLVAGEPGGEQA